jgi:N-acetylglutamate synthase-like GNAT family acetyltransferase
MPVYRYFFNKGKCRMKLRKARMEDAQAAWDIRNLAIQAGCQGFYTKAELRIWTQGEMPQAFLTMVERDFYLLEHQGKILATGMLDNDRIEALFVHPQVMGQGLGRDLLAHLESLARERGVTALTLESTLNAADFYRSCGFCGEGISQYHSPRGIVLDCVVMHKALK